MAPAISEALVATAAGIFVAIFAYTFHQIISRKIYELNIYLKAQAEIIVAKG
ncbi:MAG TPA: MotA/TolQ/ExbB proton channel family protein [Aliarcobacter cryaerophilus]|nr:MotA/TolQ/ExbB proton channel family protein [Aliarcobacter cryaerophilus]